MDVYLVLQRTFSTFFFDLDLLFIKLNFFTPYLEYSIDKHWPTVVCPGKLMLVGGKRERN